MGINCGRPKTVPVHFNASASASVGIVEDTHTNDFFGMHPLVDIHCHFIVAVFAVSVGNLKMEEDVGAVSFVATRKEHAFVWIIVDVFVFLMRGSMLKSGGATAQKKKFCLRAFSTL